MLTALWGKLYLTCCRSRTQTQDCLIPPLPCSPQRDSKPENFFQSQAPVQVDHRIQTILKHSSCRSHLPSHLLWSPKKLLYLHPQKEHPKTNLFRQVNERSPRDGLEVYPHKRLAFLQAKGHTRYKFRALNSHLLMHLENKGRRQEKDRRQPSPFRCLPGLCVCFLVHP